MFLYIKYNYLTFKCKLCALLPNRLSVFCKSACIGARLSGKGTRIKRIKLIPADLFQYKINSGLIRLIHQIRVPIDYRRSILSLIRDVHTSVSYCKSFRQVELGTLRGSI